jgi:hypothetical protein
MNNTAWDLHLENVKLRADLRDLRIALKLARCIYCGQPSIGPACIAHSDLLTIEGRES